MFNDFQCRHEFSIHKEFKKELFHESWFILQKLGRSTISTNDLHSNIENTHNMNGTTIGTYPECSNIPSLEDINPTFDNVNEFQKQHFHNQPSSSPNGDETFTSRRYTHKENFHTLKNVCNDLIEAVYMDESATKTLLGIFSLFLNKIKSNGGLHQDTTESVELYLSEFKLNSKPKNTSHLKHPQPVPRTLNNTCANTRQTRIISSGESLVKPKVKKERGCVFCKIPGHTNFTMCLQRGKARDIDALCIHTNAIVYRQFQEDMLKGKFIEKVLLFVKKWLSMINFLNVSIS